MSFPRMRMTISVLGAVIGDPSEATHYDGSRENEEVECLGKRHGRNFPRMRLAMTCSVSAAKIQMTVDAEIAGESPIVAAGAMRPAAKQAVEALSRAFAVSFTRSL
jgi:hypothetical protein